MLIESTQDGNWMTRKSATEIINTLVTMMPSELSPYKRKFLKNLLMNKLDQMKVVRDLTLETINLLKNVEDSSKESITQDSVNITVSSINQPKIKSKTDRY